MPKPRNVGLDLLRGVCILYVVGFWHMVNYTSNPFAVDNGFTDKLTSIILGAFVFVSGYLLGDRMGRLSAASVGRFYASRVLRIYPLYVIALVIFLSLRIIDTHTFITSMLCVSVIVPPTPVTLWFVSMLMLLYVAMPILVAAIDRLKWAWLLGFCTAVYVPLVLLSFFTSFIDHRLLVYSPVFFLAVSSSRCSSSVRRLATWQWVVAAVACVGLSLVPSGSDFFNGLLKVPLVVLGAWGLFHAARRLHVSSPRWTRAIWLLSYASYGAYLFHRPIYVGMGRLWFPTRFGWQIVYLVIVCLPVILLVSLSVQSAYDRLVDVIRARRPSATHSS